jgi:hypothetical protein
MPLSLWPTWVCASQPGKDIFKAAVSIVQVVLPKPDYTPASKQQFAFNALVSEHISLKFRCPKSRVRCGLSSVLGTVMPETPVNEDRQAVPVEYKIRMARERLMAAPTGDAGHTKDCGKL